MRKLQIALVAAAGLLLAACGGTNSGTGSEIRIDGSSTVAPLTAAAGELFRESNPDINVSVGTSGTGGGFAKFCAGETDINNASREIKPEEAAICDENGIEFVEIAVANDALTVVVNKENTWATCLTVEELKTIWSPESEGTITSWSQVRSSFPDEPLELYGAGTDSGTFDYFTDAINGEEGASRTDYNPTEDDNVTVQGVSGSKGALGYFGFSYYEENMDKLNAVQIDGGNGCVGPSSEAAQNGTYTPLSRPLFIYVSKQAVQANANVLAFVDFYVENDDAITERALFVPLSEEQKAAARAAADEL
ncbi:MAG: PstS family phosphate ABC transporter substrate-binding protein [Candidatus Nanopelagicales bacterium]